MWKNKTKCLESRAQAHGQEVRAKPSETVVNLYVYLTFCLIVLAAFHS